MELSGWTTSHVSLQMNGDAGCCENEQQILHCHSLIDNNDKQSLLIIMWMKLLNFVRKKVVAKRAHADNDAQSIKWLHWKFEQIWKKLNRTAFGILFNIWMFPLYIVSHSYCYDNSMGSNPIIFTFRTVLESEWFR